jgi:2-amino-4-hydroxy-6-hydroxymethyldihydropteridine diphosphokinase
VKAYFSLGSNLGQRADYFTTAIPILAHGDNFRLSQVYDTEPQGGVEQESYWNLVMEIETEATPRQLLERARAAEAASHRTREVRWGPRTLDVDVLLVGEIVSLDPDIVVPHPRMWERRFVLVPLRELAPDLVPLEALERAHGEVTVLGTLASLS